MRTWFLTLTLIALTGCAAAPQRATLLPLPQGDSIGDVTARHVVEKNYALGKEAIAYVGQPVVRAKDYQIETVSSNGAFVSTEAVTGGWMLSGSVTAPPGAEFKILGQVSNQGQLMYAVAFPSPSFSKSALLLDQNGVYNGFCFNFPMSAVYEATDPTGINFSPRATKFNRPTSERVSKKAGYVNFEIVYSGASRESINLLYREYTPDDLAKPAYTQNLTYDRNSTSIRFRDLLIRVHQANNEQIRYVVDQDGLVGG